MHWLYGCYVCHKNLAQTSEVSWTCRDVRPPAVLVVRQVTVGEEGFFDANGPRADLNPWGLPNNVQVLGSRWCDPVYQCGMLCSAILQQGAPCRILPVLFRGFNLIGQYNLKNYLRLFERRAGGIGQDFVQQHSSGDIAFAAFHMWPDKCAAVPVVSEHWSDFFSSCLCILS